MDVEASDTESLDGIEGYQVLEVPKHYQPLRTPARKLTVTPTPSSMVETSSRKKEKEEEWKKKEENSTKGQE